MTKRVLITGANRGIGLTFAKHFKANGWNVIAGVRNPEAATELINLQIEKIVKLDASDEESILNAAKEVGADTPINLLLNNAGTLTGDNLATATKENLMRQFEVNAVGPFLVTRAFLPNLELAVAQSTGDLTIVAQITSQMGSIERNTGGYYGYRASKTALNSITKSLCADLKPKGITSLLFHPGYVQTDMTGHRGDISTEESVRGLTTILAKVTAQDDCKYFHTDGTLIPW